MSFLSATQSNPYTPFIEEISSNWNADEDQDMCLLIRDGEQEKLQDWLAYNTASLEEPGKQKKGEIFFRVNALTSRGLSPLHIASMLGNLEAAQSFIKTGACNLNVKDLGGATAMHHAAVRADTVFMQLLQQSDADTRIQDAYGGTADDVLRQCHPHHNPLEHKFLYMINREMIEGIDQDFKRLTGADLINDIGQTPADWIEAWKEACELEESQANEPYRRVLLDLYHAFLTKPSQVYMDKDSGAGYLLRAGEDIPPFTVIGEYLGEIDSVQIKSLQERLNAELQAAANDHNKWEAKYCYPSDPMYHYQLGNVNAYHKRGLMSMMASSFPNVIVQEIACHRGQRSRFLFVTTESVLEGSILAFDYGQEHFVKRMPYVELRESELIAYFSQKTQAELLSALRNPNEYSADALTRLQEIAEEARVKYLLTTPTAMVQMVLKKIITPETIGALFDKQEQIVSTIKGTHDFEFPLFSSKKSLQQEFLETLLNFCETSQSPEAVLNACGKKSTLEILKMLKSEI